jgi:hypothetical protein
MVDFVNIRHLDKDRKFEGEQKMERSIYRKDRSKKKYLKDCDFDSLCFMITIRSFV